jgi:LmbE family N-acetylglucosaminyl deacetylase
MISSINDAPSGLSSHSTVAFGAGSISTTPGATIGSAAVSPPSSPRDSGPRVLVLSPHPDDESLGCGGTLAMLTRAGVPVDVAYMTRGEMGGKPGVKLPVIDQFVLGNQRSLEAAAACRTLGVGKAFFLKGCDGQVDQRPELSDEIFQLLESGGYTTVFCPWPFDVHKDHCATFDWLAAALEHLDRNLDVWLYEVWSTLHPNKLVAIDATLEIKRQAIQAHVTQLQNYDYLTGFMALCQYRGILLPTARFAEAFFVCNREELFLFRDSGSYADHKCFLRRQLAAAASGR